MIVEPVRRTSPKRKLYHLHAWLGFHLALLMTVVLLTGTIAVLSDEIDWLLQDDMRVTPGPTKASWGEMEEAVKRAAPDHQIAAFGKSDNDYFAYRASMKRSDGTYYFIHVDQWTGAVTGATGALTVQRFFRDLHRYLFMPNVIGLPIVASLAFVLLISLYTGLKTAGRLRTTATRMRTNRGTRVLVGDLHKAVGIWGSWFLLLMAVTGIWYLAELISAKAADAPFEPIRPELSEARMAALDKDAPIISAGEMIENATAAFPDWEPTIILYPGRPQQAIMIFGRASDPLVRTRANNVFLDPYDGSVIKVQHSEDLGTVAYLNELADPLHFGDIGGLTTQFIWFLFGTGLTGLSITGVWLTYRRLKSTMVSKAQIATMPVLLAMLIFGYFYIDKYQSDEPMPTIKQASVGYSQP